MRILSLTSCRCMGFAWRVFGSFSSFLLWVLLVRQADMVQYTS
jgi:hypothetical protein